MAANNLDEKARCSLDTGKSGRIAVGGSAPPGSVGWEKDRRIGARAPSGRASSDHGGAAVDPFGRDAVARRSTLVEDDPSGQRRSRR